MIQIHPIAVYPPESYNRDPRSPKSYEDLRLTKEMFTEQREKEINKGFLVMLNVSKDRGISPWSLPNEITFEGRKYLKADRILVRDEYTFAVYQHPEHLNYIPKFGVPRKKLFNKE